MCWNLYKYIHFGWWYIYHQPKCSLKQHKHEQLVFRIYLAHIHSGLTELKVWNTCIWSHVLLDHPIYENYVLIFSRVLTHLWILQIYEANILVKKKSATKPRNARCFLIKTSYHLVYEESLLLFFPTSGAVHLSVRAFVLDKGCQRGVGCHIKASVE